MGGLMGPDADRTFIQEMIPHHQSAVSMATMAWGHAEHPEIKTLAEAIVSSQNQEIEQMAQSVLTNPIIEQYSYEIEG